jgi:hypothetical protein
MYSLLPGMSVRRIAIISRYDSDSKTKLAERTVFQTVEDRDRMLKLGMEEGAARDHGSFRRTF